MALASGEIELAQQRIDQALRDVKLLGVVGAFVGLGAVVEVFAVE